MLIKKSFWELADWSNWRLQKMQIETFTINLSRKKYIKVKPLLTAWCYTIYIKLIYHFTLYVFMFNGRKFIIALDIFYNVFMYVKFECFFAIYLFWTKKVQLCKN